MASRAATAAWYRQRTVPSAILVPLRQGDVQLALAIPVELDVALGPLLLPIA